jgi:inner membrane protein
MCHVLFLLPVLALPVFWIWPAAIAVPLYGAFAVVGLAAYALAYRASKIPLENGLQTLLGATGRVLSVAGGRATLRVRGELWIADIDGSPIATGEEALVVAVDGLRLRVRGITSATEGAG